MSDIVDIANEREQRHLDAALAAAGTKLVGESATHCVAPDCGEAIPDERRRALPGVRHCITCADLMEKKKKGNHR